MPVDKRTVPIVAPGCQSFERLRTQRQLYVDKTDFITKWYDSCIDVLLITRPRRFGKTLMMSTLECFFSPLTERRAELFNRLKVWELPRMRAVAGTVPVVSVSFAMMRQRTLSDLKLAMRYVVSNICFLHRYVFASPLVSPKTKAMLEQMQNATTDFDLQNSIRLLCQALYEHYGTKPIVLIDEYDTPTVEAELNGYGKECSRFMTSLLECTVKSNVFCSRAIITGITRAGMDGFFSDVDNVVLDGVDESHFESAFGFTESEAGTLLDIYGLSEHMADVRDLYGSFRFGNKTGIYNPWAISNFLYYRKTGPYWVNSGSNGFLSAILKKSSVEIKCQLARLVQGLLIKAEISDVNTFDSLSDKPSSLWSMLLHSGYVKVSSEDSGGNGHRLLAVTSKEVREALEAMIYGWFGEHGDTYDLFIRALLDGDVPSMNLTLQRLFEETFGFFDTGRNDPARFFMALILAMTVSLKNRFVPTVSPSDCSGDCTVFLKPIDSGKDFGYVLEFKTVGDRKTFLPPDTDAAKALVTVHDITQAEKEFASPRGNIRHYSVIFDEI